MNYINLIKIAFAALLRNKMRAFLTMLGIIIGVASVIAMLAIGEGSKVSIREQVSSMGTNMISIYPMSQRSAGVSMGNAQAKTLSMKDIEAIEQHCSAVSMVSPEVRSSGQIIYADENAPTTIYGGGLDYLEIKNMQVEQGRMFTEPEIASMGKVCVVGKTVVKNLFGSSSASVVGKTIRFKSIPLKIIGVIESKGQGTFGQDMDDIIIAPYTTVQKRILAITHFQSIVASARSEQLAEKAVEEIEQTLQMVHKISSADNNTFTIRSQEELIKTFTSISDVLTILLGTIAGISLLVGGIGIMNIMYVSVTERTREIGLRMAVGAKESDILMQFLMESIILSVVGGVVGIMLGVAAAELVKLFMEWPIFIKANSIILSFIICSAIGIFFGWYPARKAAKLNPIDALRYE